VRNLGKVSYTTDAGLNWIISTGLPQSNSYWDIDFKVNGNNTEVYITGDPTYIYKSTDYGLTWSTVSFLGQGQLYTSEYKCTDFGGGDTLLTVGNYALMNKRVGPNNSILLTNYTNSAGHML
jgi:hypothetical protein